MKVKNRRLAVFSLLVFMIIAVAAIRAHSYLQKSSKYIEVCRNGPVYVPPGTEFVTCYGVVKKVVGIVLLDGPPPSDCMCPACCGGTCWVAVDCWAPDEDANKSESSSGHASKKRTSTGAQGICFLAIAC